MNRVKDGEGGRAANSMRIMRGAFGAALFLIAYAGACGGSPTQEYVLGQDGGPSRPGSSSGGGSASIEDSGREGPSSGPEGGFHGAEAGLPSGASSGASDS